VEWFARLKDSAPVLEVIEEVFVSRRMHPASITHRIPDADPIVDILKRRLDRRRSNLD
jgi:hypothetical protein